MGSISIIESQRPHAVCIPYPAQGHVNPMLKLAKLLHQNGFFITFVNSDHNHRRLLKTRGAAFLDALPDFRFDAIPDGLPPSGEDANQHIPSLCVSTSTTCLEPFCELLSRVNTSGAPPVTYIVSDGMMSFTLKAAERFRLPEVLFWTTSACGVLAYTHFRDLVEKGYSPLKDISQVSDGYLETIIDWIPGMKNMKLKDIPFNIRTTDRQDPMLNFLIQESGAIPKAHALIVNTFDALERDALAALEAKFPRVYSVGPLQLMMDHIHDERLKSLYSNLWKEEPECIKWLDTMAPGSVLYVNFGSISMMTAAQMTEVAWGLARSGKPFLWIIRPNIVAGETAMVPPEFVAEVKDRSMMVSWCPQERVLKHPAVGGFLTHSGWNSTSESIVGGVPVICLPFVAEQGTNCRYSCVEWGIGMEIDTNVKRERVEFLVRELMDGDKGKKMKENAVEWKRKAEEAAAIGGSSYLNLEKLIELLKSQKFN